MYFILIFIHHRAYIFSNYSAIIAIIAGSRSKNIIRFGDMYIKSLPSIST